MSASRLSADPVSTFASRRKVSALFQQRVAPDMKKQAEDREIRIRQLGEQLLVEQCDEQRRAIWREFVAAVNGRDPLVVREMEVRKGLAE